MKVIGIDGGATKVSGCVIEKLDHKTYTLAHPVVDIKYSDHQNFNPEFLPQPIDVQHNNEDVIAVEKRQGTVYVETVLKVSNYSLRMNNSESRLLCRDLKPMTVEESG